jgi:hypothetical protein
MNPREKRLMFGLIGVVGIGVLGLGVHFWFYKPYKANRDRIILLRLEALERQKKKKEFTDGQAQLALARLRSLPANKSEASSEYLNFLGPLLNNSGLIVDEVRPGNVVDVKPVTPIQNVKTTGHQIQTFQVRAKGTMSQVVQVMEQMKRATYEHRIKQLSIDRADSAKVRDPRLVINMTIETLLVAKTESKPGMPPGIDLRFVLFESMMAKESAPTGLGQAVAAILLQQMQPAVSDRSYMSIAQRNIFMGSEPIIKTVDPPTKVDTPEFVPQQKYPGDMPKFIRLTLIESNKEEAYYLNLFYRKDEFKLSTDKTFLIASEDRPSYEFMLGKVLAIGERDVYFQKKDKIYIWHVGDTLDQATKRPLTDETLIELLYDEPFAEAEVAREKDKGKGGMPGAKGKGGKGPFGKMR